MATLRDANSPISARTVNAAIRGTARSGKDHEQGEAKARFLQLALASPRVNNTQPPWPAGLRHACTKPSQPRTTKKVAMASNISADAK